MSVVVSSGCAHCGRPMELHIDSELNFRATEAGCRPIVFMPEVDFATLRDDSIVDAF